MQTSRLNASTNSELDRQVRLLHVIPQLTNDGMERIVYELIKGTDSSRFHVTSFCLAARGLRGEELAAAGYPVGVVGPLEGFSVRHLRALSLYLEENDIEVIHAHNLTAWFYAALALLIGRRRKLIATIHGLEKMPHQRDVWTYRFLSWMTDCVVAVSDRMTEFVIKKMWVGRSQLRTIFNGIDVQSFQPVQARREEIRKNLGIAEDEYAVGAVGRMVPVKNYKFLLEAMILVLHRLPRVKLLLLGKGPLMDEFALFCKDRGIEDRVLLLGQRMDVAELLTAMDVYVLPSLYEGTSLSLLEAMVAGRPVIATDVGGNPSVVQNGTTGILVPLDKPAVLSEAIVTFLTNQKKAIEMGQAAAADVSTRFDRCRMIHEYEELYLNFLGSRHRSLHQRNVLVSHLDGAVSATSIRRLKKGLSVILDRAFILPLKKKLYSKPLILCYHRVMEDEVAAQYRSPAMVVSRSNFERQIEVLRRNFRIVSLRESIDAYLKESANREPIVSITFDDGYRDNYENAFPVLKANSISATFFITTDLVGTGRLHRYDEVALQIDDLLNQHRMVPRILWDYMAMFPHAGVDPVARRQMIRVLIQKFKKRPVQEVEELIQQLSECGSQINHNEAKVHRCMTWEMVREMKDAGMEIGSHGKTHRILTKIPLSLAREEVADSKVKLEQELGKNIEWFAYPNGDLNCDVATIVSEMGFRGALAVAPSGQNGIPRHLRIPRRDVSDEESMGPNGQFSESIFLCELMGLMDTLLLRGFRWRVG